MLGRVVILCLVNICISCLIYLLWGRELSSLSQVSLAELKGREGGARLQTGLTQQWGVTYNNVWDTLAGDMVFSTQFVYDGFVP